MYWDVIKVDVAGDKTLCVTFKDGLQGKVRIDDSFFINMYEKLKDPAEFSKVMIIDDAVAWSEQLDLAPDAMYEGIKENGEHIVYRNL